MFNRTDGCWEAFCPLHSELRIEPRDDRGSFLRARAPLTPPTYFDLPDPVAGGCDIIRTFCLPFTLFFCSFFCIFPLLHHLYPSFLDFRVPSQLLTPVWKHSPAPPPRPLRLGRAEDRRPLCLGIIITLLTCLLLSFSFSFPLLRDPSANLPPPSMQHLPHTGPQPSSPPPTSALLYISLLTGSLSAHNAPLSFFSPFRLRLSSNAAVKCDVIVWDEGSFQEVRISRTSLTFRETCSFALGDSRLFREVNKGNIIMRSILLAAVNQYNMEKGEGCGGALED